MHALFVGLFLYFLTFFIFRYLKLYDAPNSITRFHIKSTAYSGGTFLFLSFVFLDFFIFNFLGDLEFYLLFFIFLMSLIDDIYIVNSYLKFCLQTSLVFLFLLNSPAYIISSLGYYELIGNIPFGKFDIIFTLICLLISINAFNFIDGIDGLCSFNFTLVLLAIAIIKFIFDGIISIEYFFLIIFNSIFFFFNVFGVRFKSFLGDSGSTLIGIYAGLILCFESNNSEYIHPILVAWILSYPVFDLFSVVTRRTYRGSNIFMKDGTHFHHLISNYFNSKFVTLIFLFSYIILLQVIGMISFFFIGSLASLFLFISFLFFHTFLNFLLFKKKIIS